MAEKIFVTGIDTEVGKTVVSAILVEALEADYWKPVQSGDLHHTDTMKVKGWVSNSRSRYFDESYRLETPASPHLSARIDGVDIKLEEMQVPVTENHLIIEGAGGLMVPLNDRGDFILDVARKFATKVVLVSKNYLGSINHTLCSFEVLKSNGLAVDLLVFSGDENASSEEAIIEHIKPGSILRVPHLGQVNSGSVSGFCVENKELITSEFN